MRLIPSSDSSLSAANLNHIIAVCYRFEAAFRAGTPHAIEQDLQEVEEEMRLPLLGVLLALEIELRQQRGHQPALEEYLVRFPREENLVRAAFPMAGTRDSAESSHPSPMPETPTDLLDRIGRDRIEELTGQSGVGLADRAQDEQLDRSVAIEPAVPVSAPRAIAGYKILGELGRGGMGVVYRAFDEKRGVVVALKTVRRADSAGIRRFKEEFRALTDVSHPNLVALYELTAAGETWFFTMELVDGVDFLTFVRSGADRTTPETTEFPGPPVLSSPGTERLVQDFLSDTERSGLERPATETLAPPHSGCGLAPVALARLRTALLQLAEGVAALHDAGRLHRDLKPSNVLVTRDGRVVILDFGLAAELEPSGQHQSPMPYVLGTVNYMAPEQAAGRPVSPASDWYSFGSVLYEALTGRPPFLGRTYDVLRDKQAFEPPAPCELVHGVPHDLNELCVDLLRRAPETRPSGRVVLQRLGSVTAETEPVVPLHATPHRVAPFVGRARQLECLEVAFADMCRGRTVVLYIHGPSGIGKTALVQRFLDDRIGRNGVLVLAGRCYERESVPYKALDSVVDALGRYLKRLPLLEVQALLPRDIRSLVRVFPTLAEDRAMAMVPGLLAEVPDPQELRRRAFRALRELLARLGDRHPLLVAIDDLQWGDSDSAAVLSELLRPPESPRLLLLGCYRSEDAATSPLLRALLEVPEAGRPSIDRRVLGLETLEPAEAEGLARILLGREDPAARAHTLAIARESGGNPFFVTDLVRHLQADTSLLDRVPMANEVALDEVLWKRVRRLPEEARRLLEVVAVSGRPLGQAEASRAALLDADEHTAFTLLRTGRLIRSTRPAERDEIETYHDRVREAVAARIPASNLEGYHRRLALVLESSGRADPEVLAVHFQGARELDRAGIFYARAAAQAAEALAFDRAVKLYRLALELHPGDAAETRRLRMGLGNALANAGRGAESAREYLAAAVGATADETFERRRLAAMQFLSSGHLDEGLAELNAVLKAVGMALQKTPGRAVLSLILRRLRLRLRGLHYRLRDSSQVPPEQLMRIDVCWTVAEGLGFIDVIRGADFQARGLLLALKAGEPNRIARSLGFEAAHVASAGGPGQGRASELLEAAAEIAQTLDDPHTSGRVIMGQAFATYLSGQWKRAVEFSDQARDILRAQSKAGTWEVETGHLLGLWSLQFSGELAELSRRWPIVLAEARERGNRHMVAILSSFLMSSVRLAADDPERTEAELRQTMDPSYPLGFQVPHNEWFGAWVQLLLYRGDGQGAWNFLSTRYLPPLARSHLMRVQRIRVFFYERRARCALAAAGGVADPGRLLHAALADARRLEREKMPWSMALSLSIRAGVAAARGDGSRAADLFASAVTQLEAVDMNLYAAASRRRLGEILGGHEGQTHVERADSWMRQQTIQNPARMADVFAPAVV
jgi:serine/threonine protein kinase